MGNDTLRLQQALSDEGFSVGAIDGIRGQKTKAALQAWSDWAAEQPKGIDVSVYQPPSETDWGAVRGAGVLFAAIRASVSTGKDSAFQEHWKAAKQAAVLRAAYHFFVPWQDPKKQAEIVISQLKDDPGEFPVVLDVESTQPRRNGAFIGTPVSSKQLRDMARVCLVEIERLTGRRPWFYTYSAFIRSQGLEEFNDYPLWIADYREGPPTDHPKWQYLFHQFLGDTGRQVGVGKKKLLPCDLDRFRGTEEELRALAQVPAAPATSPAPVKKAAAKPL